MAARTISKTTARRLAITRQRLSGSPPPATADSIMEVVRDLGCVQIDPISVVARSPLLVLWSRLGVYDPALLDKLIYADRLLFEYWAHVASIVLTEDYPIHQWRMRNYINTDVGNPWTQRVGEWIEQNRDLYDLILAELSEKGARFSREFELDGVDPKQWVSSGWTNDRNVSRMLDFLWARGQIMVTGRSGLQKRWDLSERVLPDWTQHKPWATEAVVTSAAQKAIRALGVATPAQIKQHYTRGRYPDLQSVLNDLEQQGRVERIKVEGVPGNYYLHADDLPLLERIAAGEWQPRTTLLSPFDNLICDRKRTVQLFDFNFSIEIYVPAAKRQYGYYVLPILHGDSLIGRIDPAYDRKAKTLNVNHIYAEPDAPAEAAPELRASIESLAQFVGATQITYGEVADVWRQTIR
ncbi:MAG TPA: crosslink repair DNA glycosylase YcaQ family protein [Phototrophicaceae bacterium]|nr:crosslink repair DNA glycosylase YcaQ family protein [Phototrophicaceae bacterium]